MKKFATLIKLQKTLVDDQRAHLSKLQDQLLNIENKIAENEIIKVREQIAAQESAEASLTYGAFIKVFIVQSRELENQRQICISAVEAARLKLSELFEEQKRYEIAEDQHIKAELKEERQRETLLMDEIGNIGFLRKKNNEA